MSDIYVVTTERDTQTPDDDNHPIVFEQHLDNPIDEVVKFRNKLGNTYGKTRIAKLVFMDESEINDLIRPPLSAANLKG